MTDSKSRRNSFTRCNGRRSSVCNEEWSSVLPQAVVHDGTRSHRSSRSSRSSGARSSRASTIEDQTEVPDDLGAWQTIEDPPEVVTDAAEETSAKEIVSPRIKRNSGTDKKSKKSNKTGTGKKTRSRSRSTDRRRRSMSYTVKADDAEVESPNQDGQCYTRRGSGASRRRSVSFHEGENDNYSNQLVSQIMQVQQAHETDMCLESPPAGYLGATAHPD